MEPGLKIMTDTTPDPPSPSQIFSPSTTSASGSSLNDPGRLASVSLDEHNRIAKALADTQTELDKIKDKRREERVGWIVVSAILFNCAMILNAENLAGPLIIGVMEIALLAIIAKRMGVEEFYALFVGVMQKWGTMVMGKDD